MTKNYLQITKWLKMYILENQLKTPNFLKLYNCRSPRLLVLLQPCLWHGGSSASASRPPRPGLERTRGPLSWELRASNCQTRAVSTRSRHPAAALTGARAAQLRRDAVGGAAMWCPGHFRLGAAAVCAVPETREPYFHGQGFEGEAWTPPALHSGKEIKQLRKCR